jgi:hypothetical protein
METIEDEWMQRQLRFPREMTRNENEAIHQNKTSDKKHGNTIWT